MTTLQPNVRSLIAQAAAVGAPTFAGMCGNVRKSAAHARNERTKPMPPPDLITIPPMRGNLRECASPMPNGKTNPSPTVAATAAHTCGNVRECAAQNGNGKTNPTPPVLQPRQLSAIRLLILGRCGRDVARQLGVNEHTITRWRRLPAFAMELRRQQDALAAELRQREVKRVADYHATVDAMVRKHIGR
jgi:hypothetical protein